MSNEIVLGDHQLAPAAFQRISEVTERIRWAEPVLPEFLYHYTTAGGFAGIIESGEIRGTNFSFLNDSTEMGYGIGVAKRLLETASDDGDAPRTKEILRFAGSVVGLATHGKEYYVACFSTLCDDLNQWRGYSTTGDRYAFAFEPGKFNRETFVTFGPVVYDEVDQAARLRGPIDELRGVVNGEKDFDALQAQLPAVEIIGTVLADRLVRDLVFFKDPAFRAESEWRAVRMLPNNVRVSVNVGTQGLKPFVRMLSMPPDTLLPIRELWVLSTRLQGRKVSELLLAGRGYSTSILRESKVPFVG